MTFQPALSAFRAELVALIKYVLRLLKWGVILALVLASLQNSGIPLKISSVQTWILWAMILVSMSSIAVLAKNRDPDRRSWIGVHAGVLAVGAVTAIWVPQWSGCIVAAVFVPFALLPHMLVLIAHRNASAGDAKAAAVYGRLMGLFHPSKRARFASSVWRARARASTEEKLAAFRSLADKATPEELVLLNCNIAIAQDDWEGVLGQVRSSDATLSLKGLEIRALGELRRVDEMLMTYVWAESDLPPRDRPFSRLHALAFSGHIDGVRSLLDRRLRFVRPKNKAYWIFVATQAAGINDDDARRSLASYADAADDETFRGAARRHLADGGIDQA